MFALVRKDGKVGWVDLPPPQVGSRDVRIAPRLVGICRTDIAVATGSLSVEEPRILGHEVVGEVIEVGTSVRNLAVGDSVAINPTISCGDCRYCTDGWEQVCEHRTFLGVDRDGALAESVVVPARNAWAMPIGMDDARAAMLEPVAACAAVLKAPIDPDDRGVINGDGRLTQLTRQILATHGIDRLDDVQEEGAEVDPYDFAIDTEGDTESILLLLRRLRPGGLLVLKSRPIESISLSIRDLLPREPVIYAVNYGTFAEARRLLVDGELDVTNLIGTIWPAEAFVDALIAAAKDEQTKHFLCLPTDGSASESMEQACDIELRVMS